MDPSDGEAFELVFELPRPGELSELIAEIVDAGPVHNLPNAEDPSESRRG